MYKITISKEEINNMDRVAFPGKIVVIDKLGDEFDKAIKYLKSQKVIGFDTETRPCFSSHQTHHKVSLLQLSGPNIAYLFRIQLTGVDERLIDIMADKNIVKVGAAILDDLRGLKKYKKFQPASCVDLQKEVWRYGIRDKSVKKMTAIILGYRISKAQQLSNWEAKTLSDSQQLYAATDAWVCLEIYNRLKNSSENPLTPEQMMPPNQLEAMKKKQERLKAEAEEAEKEASKQKKTKKTKSKSSKSKQNRKSKSSKENNSTKNSSAKNNSGKKNSSNKNSSNKSSSKKNSNKKTSENVQESKSIFGETGIKFINVIKNVVRKATTSIGLDASSVDEGNSKAKDVKPTNAKSTNAKSTDTKVNNSKKQPKKPYRKYSNKKKKVQNTSAKDISKETSKDTSKDISSKETKKGTKKQTVPKAPKKDRPKKVAPKKVAPKKDAPKKTSKKGNGAEKVDE